MTSFIIWSAARSGSINLCDALGAESEPFNPWPPKAKLADIYLNWPKSADHLEQLCEAGYCLKHLPEGFGDDFNVGLARIASRHGYRHIHLVRRDELARLVSRGIAMQTNAWIPAKAKAKFAELREGRKKLAPLDVDEAMRNTLRVRRAWNTIAPHLGPTRMMLHEHLTSRNVTIRHATLLELIDFLELPYGWIVRLKTAMRDGGQRSEQVWDLVPNIAEMRAALLREGLL